MTLKPPSDASLAAPTNLPQQNDVFTSEGAPPPGKVSNDVPAGEFRPAPGPVSDKPRRKRVSAARYP